MESQILTLPTIPPIPSFDQIVKGNVTITKLNKYKYKYNITFSKIGKFLQYQVWDKDNANNQNDKRIIRYISAKQWVNTFNELNEIYKKTNKPLFNPTTIMETEDHHVFAFVINNAYFNPSKHLVFTVSTSEISSSCKKLIQLPIRRCLYNVRFDIDSSLEPLPCYYYIRDNPKFPGVVYIYASLFKNSDGTTFNFDEFLNNKFDSLIINNSKSLNFKLTSSSLFKIRNDKDYLYIYTDPDTTRDKDIKDKFTFKPSDMPIPGSLYEINPFSCLELFNNNSLVKKYTFL
jgi:hypothetical protein